jgi:diguanylate cyclase (GGDEF)-like protein
MSVIILVLSAAVLLGILGFLGGGWLWRRGLRPAEPARRALARAREPAPPAQKSATPDTANLGVSAAEEDATHDEPTSTPAAGVPAATTLSDLAPATQEMPPPSPPAGPAPGAAGIWNRSGDVLTGECDQTAFRLQIRQRIAQWNRGGPGFSVMLVQVDRYRQLMKTHGSNAVECALRATRLYLAARLRAGDVFDRYRHDCFAVLLPDTCLADAVLLAERVRNNASGCLWPTKHGALEVTRCLGVAAVSHGDDEASLLRRAEAALKAAACNRTCCHDGHRPQLVDAAAAPNRSETSAAAVAAATDGIPSLSGQTRT